MTDETSSSEPRYSIAWTPGGDLVFRDGSRQIEMGHEQKRSGSNLEITLFAKTVLKWRYPYSCESITDEMLEHILTETKKLLEEWGMTGGARVHVKINRTDIGGDCW